MILREDGSIVEAPLFDDRYLSGARNRTQKYKNYVLGTLLYSLGKFLISKENVKLIRKCMNCRKFYLAKTARPSKFCSSNCRLAWHNRKRIKSGEARKYKAKKRREGAKESYYG